MMIESLNPDLVAHRGAPDKDPERRLATLRWAGELAIPFTTGILVGIGESRSDRVVALEAIAAAHRDFGHVQEVIVQNFVPKPGTLMRDVPPCSLDDLLETIALARSILPADVHLQAPPNLVDDPGALIDAGIDDFGGISPGDRRPREPRAAVAARGRAAGGRRVPGPGPGAAPDDLPGVRPRPRHVARRERPVRRPGPLGRGVDGTRRSRRDLPGAP